MRIFSGELEEIVSIARDHHTLIALRSSKNYVVRRVARKKLSELDGFMPMSLEGVLDRGGDVVVEQEFHLAGS